MKKALIASTALVLSAGVAAADVTLSGYARTGLDYIEGRDQEAQVNSRVRLNVRATTSTDQGVDFGATTRIQWDQGEAAITRIAPGQIFVTASGLTVSVGNVGTAFDSAGLLYASEIGIFDRSLGNPRGSFFAYASKGYGTDTLEFERDELTGEVTGVRNSNSSANRVGIAATYALDALTARISYVDPNQTIGGTTEEIGISADYTMDAFAVSAGAVWDGAGISGNDQYFLGGQYTLPGSENKVGLNWIDNNTSDTFVGYGEFEVAPATTVKAYIANNDFAGNTTDWAYGIGGRYDLGGAYLATAIHRNYEEDIIADFGLRLNF